MTIASHTPGPWRQDWQFIVADDPSGRHPDIYIAEIAEEDSDGRVASPGQREANARLIAAAPALLSALQYLLEQTVEQDLRYGIGLTEGEADARAGALAALAEAGGIGDRPAADAADRDSIALGWSVEDVLEVRPDLDAEQGRAVLEAAERSHDATIGVNWDVLECHAERLFGFAPDAA